MRDITNEAPPSGAVSSGAVVTHGPAAEAAAPLVEMLLGAVPVRLELWDGTSVGPDGETCTTRRRSPDSLRRVLWSHGELGLHRAFLAGGIGRGGGLIWALKAHGPARTNMRAAARKDVVCGKSGDVRGDPALRWTIQNH